jgi:hypothetical protein
MVFHWSYATALKNRKVLITGGSMDSYTSMKRTELYDPSTGMWINAGKIQVKRAYHAASMLTNGKISAIGESNPKTINNRQLH